MLATYTIGNKYCLPGTYSIAWTIPCSNDVTVDPCFVVQGSFTSSEDANNFAERYGCPMKHISLGPSTEQDVA